MNQKSVRNPSLKNSLGKHTLFAIIPEMSGFLEGLFSVLLIRRAIYEWENIQLQHGQRY